MEFADFETMSRELDKLKSEIFSLTGSLEALGSRAETIAKQQKRGLAVRDESFQSDFAKFTAAVKEYAQRSGAFWQAAGALGHRLSAAGLPDGSELAIRRFANRARAVNSAMEEFNSVFKFARRKFSPNRAETDWWPLEVGVTDIEKTSGRILYIAREISKLAESRRNPGTEYGEY
ncbi:MAG: hypothetical protein PHW69_06295 [Elusimicrobiaceae bacterium]|nr:hypothetical protein [Elusimicrobiaceae bacterium]